MGNLIKLIIAGLVLLIVGIGIGRYLTPAKIEQQIVEKEVTKTQEHTVTVVVKDPTGKETTTITKDLNTISKGDKSTTTTTTGSSRPDWRAYVGTGFNFNQSTQTYIFGVDRRILGELTIGVYGTTGREAGVTLGYAF